MAKRATKDAMNELHRVLAEQLADGVANNKEPIVVNGEVVGHKRNAAILNVARQFLKDNGIEGQPVEGSPLAFLKDAALPFADLQSATDDTLQ